MTLLRNLAIDILVSLFLLALWLICFLTLPDIFRTGVTFYDGLGAAIFSAALGGGLFLFFSNRDRREVVSLLIALTFMTQISILVLGPVAIDRSLSLYLLHKISEKESVTEQEFNELISSDYPIELKAGQQRKTEQQKTGNLIITDEGKIQITQRGLFTLKITNAIRDIFRLNELPGRQRESYF